MTATRGAPAGERSELDAELAALLAERATLPPKADAKRRQIRERVAELRDLLEDLAIGDVATSQAAELDQSRAERAARQAAYDRVTSLVERVPEHVAAMASAAAAFTDARTAWAATVQHIRAALAPYCGVDRRQLDTLDFVAGHVQLTGRAVEIALERLGQGGALPALSTPQSRDHALRLTRTMLQLDDVTPPDTEAPC